MREILFRGKGKGKDAGKWYEGFLFRDDLIVSWSKTTMLGLQGYNEYNVLSQTIGQFTGLKDKQGTKIFEDDIVLIDDYEPTLATIKWDSSRAMFYIVLDDLYYTFDDYYGKDLIVMGNIYDNPELLE